MDELTKALYASIPAFLAVVTTGLVGAGLAFLWNLQLKRRELDLAAAKRFHELYGEFFAVWKLWNYYVRDVGQKAFPEASDGNSWIGRARLNLVLRRLSLSSALNAGVRNRGLGRFRQAYQKLRESIRDNRPIEWDWSDHHEYSTFKQLAPRVAQLIRTGRKTRGAGAARRANAWLIVASNKFEDFWIDKRR